MKFAVIPHLARPVSINDNFDAWNDIPAFHLRPERAWITPAVRNIVDDLPVKIAWDNRGIALMVDMTTVGPNVAKAHAIEFWHSDAVEVFIDTMNAKDSRRGNGSGQQFWCWPFGSLDDDKSPGGESIFERPTGFNFSTLSPGELPHYARPTARGYQLQWRIPVQRIRGAVLVPGKILGLNLVVDAGGDIHYFWSASKVVGTSVHPDTWGDVLLGGSDGRIEFPAGLAVEATPAGAGKMLSAFAVGQPLRIRVIDPDMNLSDQAKDKVTVTVANHSGEQEVATLEETGTDTGIFEGSVRTTLAIGESSPGALSVYEGESVTVTYIDKARANGARNARITSRILAGPAVTYAK